MTTKTRKTTIHDIAKRLNVTASTVSRALNDSSRISEKTKAAVHKAAMALHYQPNNIAAALRNGKSNIIGVIVPTVDRSFFSSVVRGIEDVATKSGYHVMICQSYENYQNEVAAVETLLNARVDGIIVSHAKSTTNFDHFLKVKMKGTPLILFDRSNEDLQVSHIVINDYLGAYRATEHLIQQGCKRIAHFTNVNFISIFKERLRGYREALEHYKLPYNEARVISSNLQLEDGRNGMMQLLATDTSIDAVFSSSALSAMGALQVLKEKKIKVPDEVALIGFSNEQFTSLVEPTLSTIDQHSTRIGNVAAEIFLKEVVSQNQLLAPQKIVLVPQLIIRQSSLRNREKINGK